MSEKLASVKTEHTNKQKDGAEVQIATLESRFRDMKFNTTEDGITSTVIKQKNGYYLQVKAKEDLIKVGMAELTKDEAELLLATVSYLYNKSSKTEKIKIVKKNK